MLPQWLLAGAIIASSSVLASDYRPTFDPAQLKGPQTGTPNEVLVLGTPHLSSLPSSFSPAALTPLLARLEAWKPQIITIEALSGAQCDFMRRYPVRYAETVKTYCRDTALARKATGMDVAAASMEVDRLLASWPAEPSPAQRRHLAAVFLASGEPESALVQWLRLPAAEQRHGNGLAPALVQQIKALAGKRNERSLIAAVLAARLGLERVYPTDDHTADYAPGAEEQTKAYGETLQRLWDNPATAQRSAQDAKLFTQLQTGEGVLALYQTYNQSGQAQLIYESDFGAAMKDQSAAQYGRNYVGYWETRNLRMAANIRNVLDARPGKRLLTIVGASHKAYFEAYLNMMHDVKLHNTEDVLR